MDRELHTPLPSYSRGHLGAMLVQVGLEPGAEHTAQTRPQGGQAWEREAGPCYRRPPPSPAPPQAPDNPSPHPWLLRAATGGTGLPERPPGPTGLLGSEPSREGPGHWSLLGWGPEARLPPAQHPEGRQQVGWTPAWGQQGRDTHGSRPRDQVRGVLGDGAGEGGGGQTRALHQKGERWS